eukprot:GILI01021730.1.p1 GENE.GILI01021730.1~~GILI01021730.1.p1  ORF type:complete len:473 (+),score=71.08 GILI01021730.1:43-1419(+)
MESDIFLEEETLEIENGDDPDYEFPVAAPSASGIMDHPPAASNTGQKKAPKDGGVITAHSFWKVAESWFQPLKSHDLSLVEEEDPEADTDVQLALSSKVGIPSWKSELPNTNSIHRITAAFYHPPINSSSSSSSSSNASLHSSLSSSTSSSSLSSSLSSLHPSSSTSSATPFFHSNSSTSGPFMSSASSSSSFSSSISSTVPSSQPSAYHNSNLSHPTPTSSPPSRLAPSLKSVHKEQGMQYEKPFIITHDDRLQLELLSIGLLEKFEIDPSTGSTEDIVTQELITAENNLLQNLRRTRMLKSSMQENIKPIYAFEAEKVGKVEIAKSVENAYKKRKKSQSKKKKKVPKKKLVGAATASTSTSATPSFGPTSALPGATSPGDDQDAEGDNDGMDSISLSQDSVSFDLSSSCTSNSGLVMSSPIVYFPPVYIYGYSDPPSHQCYVAGREEVDRAPRVIR